MGSSLHNSVGIGYNFYYLFLFLLVLFIFEISPRNKLQPPTDTQSPHSGENSTMSTASFLTFATLLVLMTLSWSQPGRAAPTSNDSNPDDEAEAEAEGLLVEGQRLIVLNAQKGEVIITPWNATDKYIELTTQLGSAHATNSYSNGYNAEKAFKIIEEGYGVYWCTSSYPDLPVFLWFQFNNPKTVFKVKFVVDRCYLPTENVYEVF